MPANTTRVGLAAKYPYYVVGIGLGTVQFIPSDEYLNALTSPTKYSPLK